MRVFHILGCPLDRNLPISELLNDVDCVDVFHSRRLSLRFSQRIWKVPFFSFFQQTKLYLTSSNSKSCRSGLDEQQPQQKIRWKFGVHRAGTLDTRDRSSMVSSHVIWPAAVREKASFVVTSAFVFNEKQNTDYSCVTDIVRPTSVWLED